MENYAQDSSGYTCSSGKGHSRDNEKSTSSPPQPYLVNPREAALAERAQTACEYSWEGLFKDKPVADRPFDPADPDDRHQNVSAIASPDIFEGRNEDPKPSGGHSAKHSNMMHTVDSTTELPQTRALWVSTLKDHFQVTEVDTTSVADLRATLQNEKFGVPVDIFLENGGQKLLDTDIIGNLPAEANLVCVASMLGFLERRVGELQSPGDPYQKYLRSYEGVSAGDARVLKTIWAVATLGATRGDDNAGSSKQHCRHEELDQVAAAVIKLIQHIWQGSRRRSCDDSGSALCNELSIIEPASNELMRMLDAASAEDLQRLLASSYSCEAHERLLEWLLETPNGMPCERGKASPRLRVMLAEIEQILCRGADCLVSGRGNGRQCEAYRELLKVASCSNEPLLHMCAFGSFGH